MPLGDTPTEKFLAAGWFDGIGPDTWTFSGEDEFIRYWVTIGLDQENIMMTAWDKGAGPDAPSLALLSAKMFHVKLDQDTGADGAQLVIHLAKDLNDQVSAKTGKKVRAMRLECGLK